MTIPLCDPAAQYAELREQIDAAVGGVLAGGRYILGPNVKAFESEMAAYLGCDYAIGVNSGTDALHLALRALGVGPGDEVITTPFTFVATSEAIGMVGATPVFVDIDPATYNLDPEKVEAAVTPRTRALLPVHLYGLPCDMGAVMAIAERHGLAVVEDTAQATGALYDGRRVGTIGSAGCFSFFPSKNLGCFGDGGMLVTNNARVYEQAEMLRRHGGKKKYHHSELGLNSRLDELQAATLRVKLPRLDGWNAERANAAARYDELLGACEGIALPTTPWSAEGESTTHVYHQYTVQVDRRDDVIATLKETGVQSFPYYPVPLHLQEVHAPLGYRRGDLPIAERVAERCLSLPMFPGVTTEQQETVASALRTAVATTGKAPALAA